MNSEMSVSEILKLLFVEIHYLVTRTKKKNKKNCLLNYNINI